MEKTDKGELRKKYKHLRSSLTEEKIEDLSLLIANQALKLPTWNFSFYHIFLTIKQHKEVNTDYLLHILSGKDKNIVISKSNFSDQTLTHFLLTDTTVLVENEWKIPEPVDAIPIEVTKIDVVFIPLLAFDIKGNRVGYGKGFYDRFLSGCKEGVMKIGLSFFEAEEKAIDADPLDIPLDYCITPDKIYTF